MIVTSWRCIAISDLINYFLPNFGDPTMIKVDAPKAAAHLIKVPILLSRCVSMQTMILEVTSSSDILTWVIITPR